VTFDPFGDFETRGYLRNIATAQGGFAGGVTRLLIIDERAAYTALACPAG
jgi:hypothetical protein